jgi:hypothetical protein
MAKIARKNQKVFGATGPTGVLGQFGSYKASAPTYSDDPDVIQQLSAFGQGLSGAIINNAPPPIQDVNSLFYLISRQIAYCMQTGISEWSAETTYYIGSMINDELGNIYTSVVDDNLNNAITDETKWLNMTTNFSREASGSTTILNEDYCIVYPVGATGPTGSITPTVSSNMRGRRLLVVDYTAADTLTVVGYICSGTSWILEEVAFEL